MYYTSAKFFDLGPEDEKEVKSIKTLLYLNLASCYIKLENWDQVIRNCDFALELDAVNPKVVMIHISILKYHIKVLNLY